MFKMLHFGNEVDCNSIQSMLIFIPMFSNKHGADESWQSKQEQNTPHTSSNSCRNHNKKSCQCAIDSKFTVMLELYQHLKKITKKVEQGINQRANQNNCTNKDMKNLDQDWYGRRVFLLLE